MSSWMNKFREIILEMDRMVEVKRAFIARHRRREA
jgi:hypothetical protein